jgi:HSP20 family protein
MNSALTTRRPHGLKTIREDMEEMIGRFLGEPRDAWWTGEIATPVDIAETENAFELRMDVPAMDAKDFNIEVDGNTLTVRGERKEEKEEKGKTWHRVERRAGKFARTVSLPCNVNEDEVAAEYIGGVLTLKLPKAENARPKKVTVKTGQN